MTGKCFVDTNVFVYLFTKTDPKKREKCYSIFKKAGKQTQFVVSTQVIKEFSSVMLSKFNMPPLELKSTIDTITEFEVIETHVNLIKTAIDIRTLNQLSFWDSLIISAAKSANCTMVLTEDMNDGQVIEGLKIQSPFTFQID